MFNAHVIISGFVQGIGFRHFIRSNARRLGINGWTMNLPPSDFGKQGSVEAVFQSNDKNKIEEMIGLCRKGPFMAEVKEVEVKWEEVKDEYKSFEIVQ